MIGKSKKDFSKHSGREKVLKLKKPVQILIKKSEF